MKFFDILATHLAEENDIEVQEARAAIDTYGHDELLLAAIDFDSPQGEAMLDRIGLDILQL